MIPTAFDANLHPTLNGRWLNGNPGLTFGRLGDVIAEKRLIGACAVSLPPQSPWDHEDFMEASRSIARVVPVAGVSGHDERSLVQDIGRVASMGYPAIKIHPRFLNMPLERSYLLPLLEAAAHEGLVVYLCTYYWSHRESIFERADPLREIAAALASFPELPVVLAHAGGVRFQELMEHVRFLPNAWLDLSMTLTKYVGSPVEAAITFAANHFDRRILFGSDAPDSSLLGALEQLAIITRGLPAEKAHNISWANARTLFRSQWQALEESE